MKTLNLVYPDKSDIKYRIDKFPDGQQQVIINSFDPKIPSLKTPLRDYTIPVWVSNNEIEIKTRLNNFSDLELIICSTKSLRELGVEKIHLYLPYFLGSRSDRKFEDGSNNYLKTVICPIINSLEFESVTILDPHSDVLEACLNQFKKVSNEELVKWSLADIYDNDSNSGDRNGILVSPDAGASKKIYKVAQTFEFEGKIIICSKDRDTNGNLTQTNVPLDCDIHEEDFYQDGKDFIIIDDICDGGKTFINIAEIIKESCPNSKIYLIVTHGIFSKGLKPLVPYFDGIYTTNSYQELPMKCEQIGDKKMSINQLNVF